MNKKIRYICCQPAVKYYTWQVEVLIQNFKNMGINPNYIDIVCGIENGIIPEDWRRLRQHYNSIRFFFYDDTRVNRQYIPSIYFHLMKKHIAAQPEIQDDVLFIHDSDIVFTRPVDFSSMINDKIWYLSDTNSYINYDYIQQKGNDIYLKMCEIVGIDPLIPKLMNSHSGGAQYIVKNTNYEYWDKVEQNSHELYAYFVENEKSYVKKHEHDYPIQKWTAGMWSMLWNAWLFGHETQVDRRMDFGWVTNNYDDVEKYTILHNSGVTENHTDLFYKGKYINDLPYFKKININKDRASYYYWQQVDQAAQNTILIPTDNREIYKKIQKQKITQLQLDPFGFCNAKCWFCPVKYQGNPESGKETMPVDLLEKIIKNLIDEKNDPNGLVDINFNGFYTSHYNEILLYKHFEELLKLCKKYNLRIMVLSNGTPLTPDRVDLIKEYQQQVAGICLNIPAFEPETWSKRSGIHISQFNKLISNINYAIEQLPNFVDNKCFTIQVNGADENSFTDKGGWLDKGPDFPVDMNLDLQNGELVQQLSLAKSMFPNVQIYPVSSLIDRAGYLHSVISNKSSIDKHLKKNADDKKVIGCGNGWEVGGRPIGWAHVNANGQAFLCCNDYDMEVVVGDFKTQNLRDFWGSDHHVDKILESYNTICRNCASAKFEE